MGYEKQVKKIRRFMGDLLNYFEVAEVIVEELLAKHPEISKEVLESVCLAWQWGKKKVKAKESSRKQYCTEKEKYYYAAAEQKSSGKFDEIKEKILKELDEIVQSSSIVECINSDYNAFWGAGFSPPHEAEMNKFCNQFSWYLN